MLFGVGVQTRNRDNCPSCLPLSLNFFFHIQILTEATVVNIVIFQIEWLWNYP